MNSAIIRTCERVGLVLGIAAVATCMALGQSVGMTLGVGIGALIALANLVVIRKMVTRALSAGAEQSDARPGAVWMVVFVLKLGLLIGVVFASIKLFGATPLGFMLGASSVFSTVIVIPLIMGGTRPQSINADDADAATPGA